MERVGGSSFEMARVMEKGGRDATWQIYIPDVVRMCRRTDDTMTRHVMSDKLDYRTDIR